MTQTEQTLQLMGRLGIVRPHELAAHGISPIALYSLHQQGKVQRIGRGLYTLPTLELTEHHSLAEACKRVPHGVICLLSALQFHNLGTQNPAQVWLAIDHKARHPRVEYPPLRIVRFSGAALTAGLEEHLIEGVTVRVYAPAKAVTDCFKYRNKIGAGYCRGGLARLSTNATLHPPGTLALCPDQSRQQYHQTLPRGTCLTYFVPITA